MSEESFPEFSRKFFIFLLFFCIFQIFFFFLQSVRVWSGSGSVRSGSGPVRLMWRAKWVPGVCWHVPRACWHALSTCSAWEELPELPPARGDAWWLRWSSSLSSSSDRRTRNPMVVSTARFDLRRSGFWGCWDGCVWWRVGLPAGALTGAWRRVQPSMMMIFWGSIDWETIYSMVAPTHTQTHCIGSHRRRQL